MSNLDKLRSLLKRKQSNAWYAHQLGITVDEVVKLKIQLKNEIDEVNPLNEEVDYVNGLRTLCIDSDKPLSPKELEQLGGVDNVSTFLERHWLKSSASGVWRYTIQIKTKIKDFYSNKELDIKLKELFKDTEPYKTPKIVRDSNNKKALFIYIGDDHAGMQMKSTLFNNDYSGTIYAKRLLRVVEEVTQLDQIFDELYIVRMGDELDGYNAKTTRYDHDLDSASNKEQFDIFITANKIFYGELFKKGLATNYKIINLNNSNHSGKGFSYMANKALEYWIEARFPEVKIKHQDKFIDVIRFGNHLIGLCHGKDDKYMKSPFPIVLDAKTDLWLMDFYRQYIHTNCFVSTVKADMHKGGLQYGKSGRYVNVPSICGGSSYIEHNFGSTDAGVLLEIYTDDSKNIQSIPIWFQ